MNFQVEILFGRKTTGALVQYSIEYKKTVSKSMPKPICIYAAKIIKNSFHAVEI